MQQADGLRLISGAKGAITTQTLAMFIFVTGSYCYDRMSFDIKYPIVEIKTMIILYTSLAGTQMILPVNSGSFMYHVYVINRKLEEAIFLILGCFTFTLG